MRDGDTIRAFIRSVGTHQDGHTQGGITQPRKGLQSQLIRNTYRRAALEMGLTRFFEAQAIREYFKLHRTSAKPLYMIAFLRFNPLER